VDAMRASLQQRDEVCERLLATLAAGRIPRVPGTAVFLTRGSQKVPRLLVEHVQHMGALQRDVVTLQVVFEQIPRIPAAERYRVERVGAGISRVVMRFGFVEIPNLGAALKQVKGLEPSIDFDRAVYFGTRDLVVRRPGSSRLSHGRLPLFAFLYRNAVKMVDRFNLPPQNVVEIARQVEI
jgi:KUP system potassium uptake protein